MGGLGAGRGAPGGDGRGPRASSPVVEGQGTEQGPAAVWELA